MSSITCPRSCSKQRREFGYPDVLNHSLLSALTYKIIYVAIPSLCICSLVVVYTEFHKFIKDKFCRFGGELKWDYSFIQASKVAKQQMQTSARWAREVLPAGCCYLCAPALAAGSFLAGQELQGLGHPRLYFRCFITLGELVRGTENDSCSTVSLPNCEIQDLK